MASPLVVRCQAKTYDGLRSSTLIDKKDDMYAPFLQTLAKEVKSQPLVVRKKFIKLLQRTQLLIAPLLIAPKAHAEENINFPLLEKAYGLDILPDEIVTILIQLIIGCGILGVAFAILCLMIAGGYRMIGQSDKAQMWSVDIIKGLGQVLLAPVIILLLVTVTALVFRNIPGLDIFF
jgi:hypothetical protein